MRSYLIHLLIPSLFALFVGASAVFGLDKPGEQLQEVGIFPILGNQVDLSLPFTDSQGVTKPLQDFVSAGKPIVVVPAYFGCPRLCGLLLDGVNNLLADLKLKIGEDFTLLTASFKVSETPSDALRRAEAYWAKQPDMQAARAGWHFLVGQESSVTPLMNQIGFKYKADGEDFAHTAAIVILTPQGQISQYFTGVSFSAFDTRLALVEASQGKIGSPLDHVLLFCFRFDQTQGRYTWAVFNLMRAGGIATILALGGLIFFLRRREKAQLAA